MENIDIHNYINNFADEIRDIEIMEEEEVPRDIEIMEEEEVPFYYEKSPDCDKNDNNHYIIRNTNYENHRFKKSYLKITPNDLKVTGSFIFVYAPLKRKLNKNNLKVVKKKNTTGRKYTVSAESSTFTLSTL